MDVLVIHLLNALLYASVLFLIAGGLSLIYGVMRIVNMAHGNLYAFGAYVTAWAIGSVAAGAPSGRLLGRPPGGARAAARGCAGRERARPPPVLTSKRHGLTPRAAPSPIPASCFKTK